MAKKFNMADFSIYVLIFGSIVKKLLPVAVIQNGGENQYCHMYQFVLLVYEDIYFLRELNLEKQFKKFGQPLNFKCRLNPKCWRKLFLYL
jgi:hypothetical protein